MKKKQLKELIEQVGDLDTALVRLKCENDLRRSDIIELQRGQLMLSKRFSALIDYLGIEISKIDKPAINRIEYHKKSKKK